MKKPETVQVEGEVTTSCGTVMAVIVTVDKATGMPVKVEKKIKSWELN